MLQLSSRQAVILQSSKFHSLVDRKAIHFFARLFYKLAWLSRHNKCSCFFEKERKDDLLIVGRFSSKKGQKNGTKG